MRDGRGGKQELLLNHRDYLLKVLLPEQYLWFDW